MRSWEREVQSASVELAMRGAVVVVVVAAYGPSLHVKTWEKPQERTSDSAWALDFIFGMMVFGKHCDDDGVSNAFG